MTIYFKNERRKDPWRSLEIRNQVGRNQSITQLLQPAGPAVVGAGHPDPRISKLRLGATVLL